jgi:hypothetical protein
MVVKWTDQLPTREGFWILAIKFSDMSEYRPYLAEVTFDNFMNELYIKCEVFKHNIEEPLCDVNKLPMKYSGEYKIKFSSTPIQIKNIDWDYKYEVNDD